MSEYGQPTGRLLRWLLVGPVAVAGLVAVVAGGPVLLLWLGGNPLPGRRLSAGEVMALLTSPDDGQLLMWALTVVGWLAWAMVAGSVLLELGAQLTGRRTPQLPGLSGPQRLASVLVAGVIAALTAPGISHAHAAYLDSPAPATAPASQHGELSPISVITDPSSAPSLDVSPLEESPSIELPPTGQIAPIGQWSPPDQPSVGEVPPPGQLPVGEVPPPGQLPVADQPTGEQVERVAEAADEQLVHEVAKGDWMWHIAGRYLGDEQRYPEIAALNPEYGQVYQNYPDHIQPGDRLVLPDDAYDRGERRHATGEVIGEAESAADQPSESEPESPEPESPPDPETEQTAVPIPEPPDDFGPAPTSPAPPPPAAAPPPEAAPPPPDVAPPQEAAPAPIPPPPGVEAPPADPDDSDGLTPADGQAGQAEELADTAPNLAPLLATGVLASALLGALVLYRWQKMARRRHRRAIASGADAAAEAGLRAAATADVVRLDRALRVLAAGLAAQARAAGTGPPRLPDIGAVWIGDGEIHLILASPCDLTPPEPFHASGPGSWFLPAAAPLPAVDGVMAPLPALVTIGSQPGQHLLVDLERMGMLTVTGPASRGSDLLRYLVAELVHNPWSAGVEVTLTGFTTSSAEALAALQPDRIRVAETLPEAVNQVRRRLAHTTDALVAHGLGDAVHGRVSDTAADTWAPQLLLIDRPGPEHDELLAYLEGALTEVGRRCAVAVVTTAPTGVPYGRRSITITDNGRLKAGFLDDSHSMPAAALPEHLLGPLAELLRDAESGPDHPIPPAREPWAAGTDITGGYTGSVTSNDTDPEAEPVDAAAAAALLADTPVQLPVITPVGREPGIEPVDREPEGEPVDRNGHRDPVQAESATGRSGDGFDQLEQFAALGGLDGFAEPDRPTVTPSADDASLDAAVAQWLHEEEQPPRVSILGPVQITAPGPEPRHRTRVCQELIVYLAAYGEQGADAAEISRQLWPSQPARPTVRTDVIMSVRRWLGGGADGEPWLSEAVPDGRYRLREGVLVDWHLFRRLRARGERRGLAGAEDLRLALRLVRGAPLEQAGELASASVRVPYSWLPGSPIEPELVLAGVIDTAHQLVEISLATGDLATAHWAVRQAWLADPRRSDDHPWRDLLRIRHAEGDHHQLWVVVGELLRWRDAEHPDELSPTTRELIQTLLPAESVGAGERR